MRNLRRGFVVDVCVLSIAVGAMIAGVPSAHAAWEELPRPPIAMPLGSIWFANGQWNMQTLLLGYANCGPFLVPDDEYGIYLGHAPIWQDFEQNYETWIYFDSVSEVYSNLTAPAASLGMTSLCPYGGQGGAYVDDRVYINVDMEQRIAEYNPNDDTWAWSPLTIDTLNAMPTLTADEDHEILYWYDNGIQINRLDPEIGISSWEYHEIPYEARWSVGLGIISEVAYLAGGFFIYYDKGSPVPNGESSQLSEIYDFAIGQSIEMSDIPYRTTVVGAGVGSDGIHFIGSHMTAPGIAGGWLIVYTVKEDEIYHYVYAPETDTWRVVNNDLPADCLPLSVAEQGGWLYGLFSCQTPNPHFPRMFRTQIDNLTWPPPTTTSTTTTSTTSTTQPLGDDSDDDTIDDDSVGDDDTTSPNADAPADGDDDDDGCGF